MSRRVAYLLEVRAKVLKVLLLALDVEWKSGIVLTQQNSCTTEPDMDPCTTLTDLPPGVLALVFSFLELGQQTWVTQDDCARLFALRETCNSIGSAANSSVSELSVVDLGHVHHGMVVEEPQLLSGPGGPR